MLNLSVNNAAGLSLAGADTRVTNTTTLTNGHIFLVDQNLVKDNDATFSGAGASRYVVTNGTGHLVKEDLNNSFVFPVGRATADYTPAIVDPTTATNINVQVKNYTESAATVNTASEGMNRAWHIFGAVSTPATITLQHNVSTNGAAYTDIDAFITQYQGTGTWMAQALGVDFVSAGIHTRSSYTLPATSAANTSFFTKTSDPITPLPVKIEYFNTKAENCDVVLEWKSTLEQNFSHYDVEYSTNGTDFKTIAKINGGGVNGTYLYKAPQSDKRGYYRLKMNDYDGFAEYTAIKTVETNCNTNNDINIYPNPATDLVNIKSGNVTINKITIYSVTGQAISIQSNVAALANQVDVRGLASGNYFINVMLENGASKDLN